ncbi:MAG: 50S ribosomal protein L9 [Candidatus Lambdaproteobacteria bacterium RIFOXYD2_FULL_50_16]|uniref:Large ribosomal subunit protein bL9 n=1 Tax=Candidatus Lambdaproteobacteria bacterium RIFOXYD2_FULL_50_16 TaxID=1817772 RepID=A0A1F6G9U2_9PROT|nr:MAG: 50S ribosomal protein L9 [Candidatus Lambdaproteobacteria bacterium RIFOXYD2_FULL_50_16]
MNVILTQDVYKLGSLGDEVNVKPGYARNFLIPQGKAVPMTRGNQKMVEHHRAILAKKRALAIDESKALEAKLEALELLFKVKAGESGKLFGSVTLKQIADEVHAQGIEVDRRLFALAAPIKSLGTHLVTVKLHTEVYAELKIKVAAEEIIKDAKAKALEAGLDYEEEPEAPKAKPRREETPEEEA